MAYVVKSWKVSNSINQPIDKQGNYVEIVARKAGLVAWLCAQIGIDPTVQILVGSGWVDYKKTSLAGPAAKLIPLRNVSSVFSSYYRPWREALAIFVCFFIQGIWIGNRGLGTPTTVLALVVVLVGTVSALLYYFLNRPFRLVFFEVGGGCRTSVSFKRSMIENIEVNYEKVQHVCWIIKQLVETSQGHQAAQDLIDKDNAQSSAEAACSQIIEPDIIFDCPYCGEHLSFNRKCAGIDILCSSCNKCISVPVPEA